MRGKNLFFLGLVASILVNLPSQENGSKGHPVISPIPGFVLEDS